MSIQPKLLLTALALLCALVAAPSPTSAQSTPPPLPESAILWRTPMDGDPRGLAIDEATGRIYVANFTVEQVTAVEADGSISAEIRVPSRIYPNLGPEAVAFDPISRRVYAVDGVGDLTAIDAESGSIVHTSDSGPGGPWPMGAWISLDHQERQLVFLQAHGTIGIFDLENMAETAVKGLRGDGGAVDQKRHAVYVGDAHDILTFTLDEPGSEMTLVSGLPELTYSMAIDAETDALYATAASVGLLFKVDLNTAQLSQTFGVMGGQHGYPSSVVVVESSRRVYYAAGSLLWIIDADSGDVVTELSTDFIGALSFDEGLNRLYAVSGQSLVAINATQLESPPLPSTGGPPAAPTTASRSAALGLLLTIMGLLFARRSITRPS